MILTGVPMFATFCLTARICSLSTFVTPAISLPERIVGLVTPRKGTDVGDHPPITPLLQASREAFDHDSWRLYDYIVRHFIATVRICYNIF